MSNNRRKFLKGAIAGGIGVGLAAPATNTFGAGVANEIIVGDGGEYPDVTSALDSITDASRLNPYLIKVLPGVFSLNFTTKSWVSISGSGRSATIFEGSGWDRIIVSGSNVTLSDFSVSHTSNAPNQAAIERSGLASDTVLSNLNIEQQGPGRAIANANGDPNLTWWLRNLKIRSEGTALEIGLHTYCDDLKILLHGNYSGNPHVGVKAIGPYFRIYLNNCRIGTGYWAGYDEGAFELNNVYGDDDVIAIWVPEADGIGRIEVHGLESFVRNETTTDPNVNVNVMRVEGSWLRAFGCFGQGETPMNWSVTNTVYQSQNGKVEQFACRLSDVEGNTYGAIVHPTQAFTVANNNYVFGKFEGGLHRIDTSGGDVILVLPGYSKGQLPGEEHYFKITNGDNSLILQLNGNTLEGSTADPVITGLYTSIRLIWDGVEWIYG